MSGVSWLATRHGQCLRTLLALKDRVRGCDTVMEKTVRVLHTSDKAICFLECAHRPGYSYVLSRSLAPRKTSSMDQRKYDRVRVEYSAAFSGHSYRAPGTILNLSIVGCRAHTPFVVKKDEYLGVLIDVPKYEHPIYVARAEVRWSDGREFGMEFIHIELEDRQRLCETIRAIEAAPNETERD